MPQKTIISVGFEVPGDSIEFVDFYSDRSLMDADIAIFAPVIIGYETVFQLSDYMGLDNLDDYWSRKTRDAVKHWRSEIKAAVESGKTVFVYLTKPTELYAATGTVDRSGTGRSMKTIRLVDKVSSYDCIPFKFGAVVPKGGVSIKPKSDLGELAEYWSVFGEYSEYEVYVEAEIKRPLLVTKTGDKVVGFVAKATGSLVFLPYLRFRHQRLIEGRDDRQYWTDEALGLAERLKQLLISIDKAFRSTSKRSPTPTWVQSEAFLLDQERQVRIKLDALSTRMRQLEEERRELNVQLQEHGYLRDLLFESGKQLEEAVRRALRLIGFDVGHFDDGTNEFDAVFTSGEGRFLGEVEGKENSAINISKLRQLEQNIQEDYARDDINDFAKGILFGNAFRMMPVEDRGDFFTAKCLASALRSGTALVKTPDLFVVAKRVSDSNDADFAKRCRQAIADSAGSVVQFPVD